MQFRKFNKTTITVNGTAYESIDAMPPDVRQQYEEAKRLLTTDRDGNGTPDGFEGKYAPADGSSQNGVVISSVSWHIVENGSEIETTGDTPHAVREEWMDAVRDESETNKQDDSSAAHAFIRPVPEKSRRELNLRKWLPLAVIFGSALIVLYWATTHALKY